MKPAKVIKRYANRKLYDTERSCYVTLDEISQMIKDGDEVRVIDNKSKDDLTAVTLAQIIVEEEKKVAKMPLKLLRSIIQSGNEALGDFYQKRVADPVQSLKDEVERRVDQFRKGDGGEKAEGDGTAPIDGAPAPEGAAAHGGASQGDGVVKELMTSATEAFESWQRRIDERVKDAIAKMPTLKPAPEVEALRSRIDELEAKLKEIEARKGA